MNTEDRVKKVQELEKVKSAAFDLADRGANSTDVRNFISENSKKIAYEYPDTEAFSAAKGAAAAYKRSREV
jgi:hypothetical protein